MAEKKSSDTVKELTLALLKAITDYHGANPAASPHDVTNALLNATAQILMAAAKKGRAVPAVEKYCKMLTLCVKLQENLGDAIKDTIGDGDGTVFIDVASQPEKEKEADND